LKKSDGVHHARQRNNAIGGDVYEVRIGDPNLSKKDYVMTMRPLACLFAATLLALPAAAYAQGVPRGAQTGARIGNETAGPVGGAVGGVVGGVTGGVVGGVKGVLGVPQRTAVRARHQRHHYNRNRR